MHKKERISLTKVALPCFCILTASILAWQVFQGLAPTPMRIFILISVATLLVIAVGSGTFVVRGFLSKREG